MRTLLLTTSLLLVTTAEATSGNFGFIKVKENALSHYSVVGTIALAKNVEAGDILFDLYFTPAENGTIRGIMKNMKVANGVYGSISESERQRLMSAEFTKHSNRPFLVHTSENGTFYARYIYDDADYENNPLYWRFFRYWFLLDFEPALRDGIDARNESFSERSVIKIDFNKRICATNYTINYANNDTYETSLSIDSRQCQTDDKLVSLIYPHIWGYNVTLNRTLEREDLTLLAYSLRLELLDNDELPLTNVSLRAFFKEFVEFNERVFQPQATPLETQCLPLASRFPSKPDHDAKFHVVIDINDPKTKLKPEFDLNLRDSGNDTFFLGQVTNLTFVGNASDVSKYIHEYAESPFVLGFSTFDANGVGIIMYKFLRQLRFDDPIGDRAFYLEGFAYPFIFRQLEETVNSSISRPGSFRHGGLIKCIKKVESQPEDGQLIISLTGDTNNCTEKSASGALRLILDNRFSFVDDKLFEINYHFILINTEKVEEDYVEVRVDVKFSEFVTREQNADIFKLYGKSLDEIFFTNSTEIN